MDGSRPFVRPPVVGLNVDKKMLGGCAMPCKGTWRLTASEYPERILSPAGALMTVRAFLFYFLQHTCFNLRLTAFGRKRRHAPSNFVVLLEQGTWGSRHCQITTFIYFLNTKKKDAKGPLKHEDHREDHGGGSQGQRAGGHT